MRRVFILAAMATVIAGGFVWLRVSALTAGEFYAVVVEVQNPEAPPSQWKLLPLQGAEVTAVWRGSTKEDPVNFHSGSQRCMGVKTTITNADGKAIFPKWYAQWGDTVLEPFTTASMTGFVQIKDADKHGEIWYAAPGLHVLRRGQSQELGSRQVALDAWCRDRPDLPQQAR
jgi:hypothetical protein